MREQIEAFNRGKEELGDAGKDLTLTVLRVGFMCHSEMEKRERMQMAQSFAANLKMSIVAPGLWTAAWYVSYRGSSLSISLPKAF